jgi:hypothetical protein
VPAESSGVRVRAEFVFIGAYAGLWSVMAAAGILRAIGQKNRTDEDARRIRVPSSIKWGLLAIVWIALAFVPASLVPSFAGRLVIPASYLLAAVVCLAGLALSRAAP